ncbi:MAG TPA: hypothetical protein VIE44_14955, partial [Methylomirabilota bacterium]
MKTVLAVSVTLLAAAWAPAGAGELIFANGQRLAGELSNETLMVSTGSGLVEIAPDDVVALSPDEIRLRDGRVVRGTLVGGQVKARTSLGEISVKVDELKAYRGTSQTREAGAGAAAASGAQPASSGSASAGTTSSPAPGTSASPTGITGGLPTVAAYQDAASARQGNGTATGSVQPAVSTTSAGRTLEVVGESTLYRDALSNSSRVGRVAAGQQVRYVDSIDRRLRILNLL